MNLRRSLFLQIALFAFAFPVIAQQNPGTPWCGTTGMTPWMQWYQSHRAELAFQRGVDTAWLYVPVTIHIVGDDSGNGYYSMEKAFRIICEMNEQYEEARMHFYLLPGDAFRFHNKTSWYVHDWDGGSEMINANKLPNRVNAFIVADPAGNCGYSWQDAIVMGKNCSGEGNSTWAHEAGHHFSLPHPFLGWENQSWDYSKPAPKKIGWRDVEKTDKSNCYTSGDGFCDTPADYLNFRWPCNGSGESVQTQVDPDSVVFRSDATLYMGYALDACSGRFTPEQITAMRTNLQTEHQSYLQLSEALPLLDDSVAVSLVSPIDTQIVHFQNPELKWNMVPGVTFYSVEVSVLPSFVPRIFSATVTNGNSVIVNRNLPKNYLLYWRVKVYSEGDLCNPNEVLQTGVFRTQDLTATNELERNLGLDLSPNPVSSGIPAQLTLSTEQGMEVLLEINDAAGRSCRKEVLNVMPGENRISLETSGLASGMYFITLRNAQGAITKRLAVTE